MDDRRSDKMASLHGTSGPGVGAQKLVLVVDEKVCFRSFEIESHFQRTGLLDAGWKGYDVANSKKIIWHFVVPALFADLIFWPKR